MPETESPLVALRSVMDELRRRHSLTYEQWRWLEVQRDGILELAIDHLMSEQPIADTAINMLLEIDAIDQLLSLKQAEVQASHGDPDAVEHLPRLAAEVAAEAAAAHLRAMP